MAKSPRNMSRGIDVGSTLFESNNELRSDYDAAKKSRFKRNRVIPANGSHGDYHYRNFSEFLRIMEFARDIDRNDPVLGSILDRAGLNTIQSGFEIDFDTSMCGGSVALDQDLTGWWNEWARTADLCDVAGELTFGEMQGVAFNSSKVDGDFFILGTDNDQLQSFEAHRVRDPKFSASDERPGGSLVHGILLGEGRVRKSIYVTNDDLGLNSTSVSMSKMTRYDYRDDDGIRRVFDIPANGRKRVSQTRCLSAYQKLFEMSGMLDDTQFAALLKQQLTNALVFVTNRGGEFEGGPDVPVGSREQRDRDDGTTETIEGIGPGLHYKGKPGETTTVFHGNSSGPEYFQQVKLILTVLGVNLGMPLILVLMDASETNFSGWRGAFEQAKMGFRDNQNLQVLRFCNPVLAWRLASRAKSDSRFARTIERVRRKSRSIGFDWFVWHTPTWPYIQPEQERAADLLAVANYQEAPSTNMAKSGRNYDRETKRGIEDRGRAIEWSIIQAKEINARHPDLPKPVDREELYTAPQPKHVSMSISESLQPVGSVSANDKKQTAQGGVNV